MVRRLIVQPVEGLGNRIRVILSGMRLADMSQRQFGFIWEPQETCGCEFTDLFVDRPERLVRFTETPDLRYDGPHSRIIDVQSQNDLIYVRSYQLLRDSRPHDEVEQEVAGYWDRLNPLPWIRQRVDDFEREYFTPKTLGVHIRRGDHTNYLRMKKARMLDAQIGSFQTEIEAYLAAHPSEAVFVATDDGSPEVLRQAEKSGPAPSVVNVLRERFGDRIVVHPARTLDRTSPEAIQDALVDLMLLNRTNFLLGSTYSSFSNLAIMENLLVRRSRPECLKLVGPNLMKGRWQRRARLLKRKLSRLRTR